MRSTLIHVAMFAALFAGPASAVPLTESDALTTYTAEFNRTTVAATTCDKNGCVASGGFYDLNSVCAIVEGQASVTASSITRKVYVLETGTDKAPSVKLRVYSKSYTGTSGTRPVTITLQKTLSIARLTGGATATCSMAANASSVVIGTSKSTNAIRLDKTAMTTAKIAGFGSSLNLSRIVGDDTGNITVVFGLGSSARFRIIGPTGLARESGAGDVLTPNQTNAVTIP